MIKLETSDKHKITLLPSTFVKRAAVVNFYLMHTSEEERENVSVTSILTYKVISNSVCQWIWSGNLIVSFRINGVSPD